MKVRALRRGGMHHAERRGGNRRESLNEGKVRAVARSPCMRVCLGGAGLRGGAHADVGGSQAQAWAHRCQHCLLPPLHPAPACNSLCPPNPIPGCHCVPLAPCCCTAARRYQLLRGRRARFVPGWDTHGLPIELKVLQGLPEKERRGLGPLELRRKARDYALTQVDKQREQFKRWVAGWVAWLGDRRLWEWVALGQWGCHWASEG